VATTIVRSTTSLEFAQNRKRADSSGNEIQLENIMAEENKSHRASGATDAQNKFESSKVHARKAAEDLRGAAEAIAGEYRGKAEDVWNAAQGKAEQVWTDARGRAEHAWDDARTRARTFQDDAEQYVRENPTKAIFTALGVGFVLGLIFRR
jgi:ElaB/YqjD/DUF883 family membrane-anchored ribosome-binding protein